MDKGASVIAKLANDAEMITKWNYFLRTIKISEFNFGKVVDAIVHFLSPVWKAILEEDELLEKWDTGQCEWV